MGLIGAPSICLSYLLIKEFRFDMQNNFRIAGIMLIMTIFTFSLFENLGSSLDILNDKVIHFTAYLVLSFLVFTASLTFNRVLLLTGLVSLGVLIEFLQYISGLRNFEYMDIIANTLGVLVGFLIFKIREKSLKITN